MINLNAVGTSSNVVAMNKHQNNDVVANNTKVATQGSTVVAIQGKNLDASGKVSSVVSKESASSMAFDIASMLGKSGMGVQANLNSFDAARLLAD